MKHGYCLIAFHVLQVYFVKILKISMGRALVGLMFIALEHIWRTRSNYSGILGHGVVFPLKSRQIKTTNKIKHIQSINIAIEF